MTEYALEERPAEKVMEERVLSLAWHGARRGWLRANAERWVASRADARARVKGISAVAVPAGRIE
jgi:hypothetical protein